MQFYIKLWKYSGGKFFYENLDHKVDEKINPHNESFSKYLITLSTTAIGFSFAFLQFVRNSGLHSLSILKIGFVFLLATIIFGILYHAANILKVFFRAVSDRSLRANKKLEDLNQEEKAFFLDQMLRSLNSAVFSYYALFLQSLMFLLGIAFLFYFIYANL